MPLPLAFFLLYTPFGVYFSLAEQFSSFVLSFLSFHSSLIGFPLFVDFHFFPLFPLLTNQLPHCYLVLHVSLLSRSSCYLPSRLHCLLGCESGRITREGERETEAFLRTVPGDAAQTDSEAAARRSAYPRECPLWLCHPAHLCALRKKKVFVCSQQISRTKSLG